MGREQFHKLRSLKKEELANQLALWIENKERKKEITEVSAKPF